MRYKLIAAFLSVLACASMLWSETSNCGIDAKMGDMLCSKWDFYDEDDFVPAGFYIEKPTFPDPPAKDTANPAEYQEYRDWVSDSTQKYLDEKADTIRDLFAKYELYEFPEDDPSFFVDPEDSSMLAMVTDSVFTDTVRINPDSIGIGFTYIFIARKSVCRELIQEPIIAGMGWTGLATCEADNPAQRAARRTSESALPYKLNFGNIHKNASTVGYDLKGRQLLNAPAKAGKNAKMLIISQ
jgi:hypothetical protein